MGGGANCSKQIIVQCKKITSIFVFLAPKQFFTRREAKPKASLENYADRLYCFFYCRICINFVHIRVTADIVTAFYICEKPGNFPFLNGH